MYNIIRDDECLLVELKADFDYGTINRILVNENLASEPVHSHHLWIIGRHQAELRLGDIQTLVDDFGRLHDGHPCEKKMAIVVEPGLTEEKMRLMASGIERLKSISSRVFHTDNEARQWLLDSNSQNPRETT